MIPPEQQSEFARRLRAVEASTAGLSAALDQALAMVEQLGRAIEQDPELRTRLRAAWRAAEGRG